MAKKGNIVAIKLVLDRLCPPRKDRPVPFALPPIKTPGDAAAVVQAIVNAVAAGEISPGEAAELGKLVESYAKINGAVDIEARVAKLKQLLGAS